jgi:adenylate cyclase
MGVEIERKFLVTDDRWRADVHRSVRFQQGYLARSANAAIRVRTDGEHAHLNIKSTTDGITRLELEYPIPLADAEVLLERVALRPVIVKTRHHVDFAGRRWEIDVFEAENAGLVVAEVELEAADAPVVLPPWVGREVSSDPRYYNASLSERPYCEWGVTT